MASSSQSVEVGADSMPWADASSPAQSPEMQRLAVPPRFSRKNSVSLPADLNAAMDSPDLQLTPDSSQAGDDDDLSDASSFGDLAGLSTEDSEDSDLELGGRAASPLRRVRRKSVMRPPALRVNDIDYLDVPEASPGNSITSINSIASLLKEKLALSFPAYLKKKKPPPQYKLKAFVGFLFLVIVFLVGFSYVFYHQHVLQRAFFERMRVNAEERMVRVFDVRGRRVLTGRLGQHLGESRAFPCLSEHRPADPSALCLEWTRRGRLYLSHHGPLHCYRLLWLGLDPATPPRDCYEMGRATWYGGGQPDLRGAGAEAKGAAPFVTGPRWGTTLGRHFVSSEGVAIAVDARTPLHVSVEGGGAVCLEARHDDFAYYSPRGDAPPVLNYSVCVGGDARQVLSALVEPPERPAAGGGGAELLQALLSEPVWHLAPRRPEQLTRAAVESFAEDVIALRFLRLGHVLLGAAWQTHAGDLDVDAARFPSFNDTLSVIKRRGFGLALSLQPFVSTESPSFRDAVRQRLLVRQRQSDDYVPALLRHGDALPSAGLLDVTNDEAVVWLRQRLRDVAARYQVDAFYLELGSSRDVPHFHRFLHNLSSPDAYWSLFTDAVLGAGVPVLGVSGAVRRPPVPILVSTPPAVATWDALRGVVPSVLAAGVAGFPLVMPGAVGGDYDVDDDAPPDAELYVRWLQLASFLPVLRYRRLPGVFNDSAALSVVGVAEQLTTLRTKTVTPLLKKLTDEALMSGLPLVRPLWMLDPQDPTCHKVSDEFSLGDELIVAPVVSPGTTAREVYLPAGVWKDGVDGRLHKGSRWLHRYHVQLHQVAYFEKMPNNTRF